MRLKEIKRLEGTIILKSGLHIGSGDMEMHIGGTDSPVIKHPHSLEPYIPGSSLKGKVRSLLEMESGLMVYSKGNPLRSRDLEENGVTEEMKQQGIAILKIFGSSGDDREDETEIGPTRVSFADCYLDRKWREMAQDNRWFLTEEKSENTIDRIHGTVAGAGPRFIERVPEGTKFKFLLTFKVLQEDDERIFNGLLLKGLKLLEMDALGGSGSRGYGRIAFEFNDKSLNEKFHALNPFQEETQP